MRLALATIALEGCGRVSPDESHLKVIAIGDVLMLFDNDTGASKKPVRRPCMVVTISPAIVIVAPRSASVAGKVPTPVGAASGLDKEGSFSGWRCRVPRSVAEAAGNRGQLEEPFKGEVLALQKRKDVPG